MLIGTSKDSSSFINLIRRLMTYASEDFISFLLNDISTEVGLPNGAELYERLKTIPTNIQNKLFRNPLFISCTRNFAEVLVNPSDYTKSNASSSTNYLLGLLIDLGLLDDEECWIRFDKSGKIYLPISDLILDASIKYSLERINLIKKSNELHISTGNASFSIPVTDKFLTVFSISNFGLLRLWNVNSTTFNIDSVTQPYIETLPGEWDVSNTNPTMFEQWDQILNDAMTLIGLSPRNNSAVFEVRSLVSTILPIISRDPFRHLSCSSINLPGVVAMSYSSEVVQIAQALIHEAGHNKLFLYELDDKLIETNLTAELKSPWRVDLRPPRGLIHGAFSFGGVAVTWNSLLNHGSLGEKEKARISRECTSFKYQVEEAISTLTSNCKLTETGEYIVEQIRKDMKEISSSTTSNRISNSSLSQNDKKEYSNGNSLESIFRSFPQILALKNESYTYLRAKIDSLNCSSSLQEMMWGYIDQYFERWCLPLFDVQTKTEEIKKWIALHLLCGLLWRFLDFINDEHKAKEKLVPFQKLTMSITPLIKEELIELNIDWTLVSSFLFDFMNYKFENEDRGKLSHEEIWKRATPFLLVPSMMPKAPTEFENTYKKYINLWGIIDDIVDLEEDRMLKHETWVSQIFRKNLESEKAKKEISSVVNSYFNSLSIFAAKRFPIWKTLIENSAVKFKEALSKIELEVV